MEISNDKPRTAKHPFGYTAPFDSASGHSPTQLLNSALTAERCTTASGLPSTIITLEG
jgi:hypothetical protein